MFVGFSRQIFHSFHEDKNGSLTVLEKAEHAHYTSRKFWFHGTRNSFSHFLFFLNVIILFINKPSIQYVKYHSRNSKVYEIYHFSLCS